jgi:hypothetical protein
MRVRLSGTARQIFPFYSKYLHLKSGAVRYVRTYWGPEYPCCLQDRLEGWRVDSLRLPNRNRRVPFGTPNDLVRYSMTIDSPTQLFRLSSAVR